MLINSVYDLHQMSPPQTMRTLLLQLDLPINVPLPNGFVTQGILREVNSLGGPRMVELVLEIGDEFETLFYIHHRQSDINLVKIPETDGWANLQCMEDN